MYKSHSDCHLVVGSICLPLVGKDGTPSHTLNGSRQQSWAAAFSTDSTLIAAGSGTGIVWIRNVETGDVFHCFENASRTTSVRGTTGCARLRSLPTAARSPLARRAVRSDYLTLRRARFCSDCKLTQV